MIIGLAKEHGGLCHLILPTSATKSTSCIFVSSHKSNVNLWHCRLGQPSFSRMTFLKDCISDIASSKPHHFTICPLAKQHKLNSLFLYLSIKLLLSLNQCPVIHGVHLQFKTGMVLDFFSLLLMILVNVHEYICSALSLKLPPIFRISFTQLKLNFKLKLKLFVQILELNFTFLSFLLLKALSTNILVWLLLNKMVEFRENINICSMQLELFGFKQDFLLIFGVNTYLQPLILSIDCHLLCCIISLHMNFSLVFHQHIIIFEFLGISVRGGQKFQQESKFLVPLPLMVPKIRHITELES